MTRKQAVTIIGLLVAIFVLLAAIGGWGVSHGQTKLALPIVRNDFAGASGAGQETIISGRSLELGIWAGKPITGEPIADSASPADTPTDPKLIAALNALVAGEKEEIVTTSGVSTTGSTIEVAGKLIELPDNVYVEAFIAHATCLIEMPCPPMPIYALKNRDTGMAIAISAKTGEIDDLPYSADELATKKADFKWLLDAVNGKSK